MMKPGVSFLCVSYTYTTDTMTYSHLMYYSSLAELARFNIPSYVIGDEIVGM